MRRFADKKDQSSKFDKISHQKCGELLLPKYRLKCVTLRGLLGLDDYTQNY